MENSNKIILLAVLFLCLGTFFLSYRTSVKLDSLQETNIMLLEKLDSMKGVGAPAPASASKSGVQSILDELFGPFGDDNGKPHSPRMTVSSSYRIEDRYVRYGLEKPEILGEKEGTVVVDFIVDKYGTVTKTGINAASTITDENVLDASRKAVLKTDFNSAHSMRDPQKGTVTYTFSRK